MYQFDHAKRAKAGLYAASFTDWEIRLLPIMNYLRKMRLQAI